ncbi:MAG: hypothetical protein AABW63_01255 [Nanoarchaeota archaeon]
MITIIPSIEVMKANVDNNIQSSGGELRRVAFDVSTDLMSLGDVDVLIEGILYEKIIEPKLLPDHKVFFEKTYRIDNSARGVTDYNIIQAIRWVAESESNSRKVIILSENEGDFESICDDKIRCFKPARFIELVERAKLLHKAKVFSTIDDSLMAILFVLKQ